MRKILIALAIILVTGCQTTDQASSRNQLGVNQSSTNSIYSRYKNTTDRYTQAQDGAPAQLHQISFKEPVPKKEPMSRYGNPSSYKVSGKVYQVLRSSIRYKARGMASWYGTKFHKQRTSSGEAYDMYVMSAAHRTLPLPTYVKVTNLSNGKSAVVKVNDRGPFHSSRIIDLSYAAAVKIGVYPKGTAQVEVEAVMGPAGKAYYYLQAGAFMTEASAKQLKQKLDRFIASPVFIERHMFRYIVKVGPFNNKSITDGLKKKLDSKGIKGSFSVLI